MSRRVVIDTQAFAREDGFLQGELPVSCLERVLDTLASPEGVLVYRVRAQFGPRKRVQLALEVDGVLAVRCQRCLEALEYSVQVRSLLELVDDEAALTQEEIEDDSKDFLPAQKELDVVSLIEEEIILDLPTAPRHEGCALPGNGAATTKESPFAVLKALQGKAR